MTADGELQVTGTFDGVTGRWFHFSTGSSVKLSNVTGAWICLGRKCIDAKQANDCLHVSVAAQYHVAHPEHVATSPATVRKV
jgi:hypothetical protein